MRCTNCGTELEALDAKWLHCPDCSACYPAKPTAADRGDLAHDGIREGYGPGDMADGHWQARQRAGEGAV